MTALALCAATVLLPVPANAQGAREAALEARLERLENEIAQLRADLHAARSEQASTAETAHAARNQGVATADRVASIDAAPLGPASRSGATTIGVGGFVKLAASHSRFSGGEVPTNSFGRDFYLPQTLPVGRGPASEVEDFGAKQTRLWLNLASDVAGHSLKGYVEVDFQVAPGAQGSQRNVNAYNLGLRRAWMQLDRVTLGQDWTTFQYLGALPESTDFVGGVEGSVFIRQPLVRYSAPLGEGTTLHISLENPESGTATAGSPALIENGDDRLPDLAARIAVVRPFGELSLAGLARQVRVADAAGRDSAAGYGISAGGKLAIGRHKTSDARFLLTYGRNIGRYVGLNFAADAVLDPASGSLRHVDVFAALAALHIGLAPGLRSNVMGSYQRVRYAGDLSAASLAGFDRQAWSGAVNLFYSPVPNVDFGVEYRHGERRVVGGQEGTLDRVEFAAKYGF